MQIGIAANITRATQSGSVWKLTRNGELFAVIEPSWDDFYWVVFLSDADGNLVYHDARRHIATLKVCLRLWARRNNGHLARDWQEDEQPE